MTFDKTVILSRNCSEGKILNFGGTGLGNSFSDTFLVR